MARSHHRKKHKSHVRQFKKTHDSSVSSAPAKGKAVSVFTISGALMGFAIGYFATQASMLWPVIGLLAGGSVGYYIGKKTDEETQ